MTFLELMKKFPTEKSIVDYYVKVRYNGKAVCNHCGSVRVYQIGGKPRKDNDHQKMFAQGEVHTNNIESFWATLKRGVYGIYHHVSVKHMQSYVDEFCFRYNYRKCDMFNMVIKQSVIVKYKNYNISVKILHYYGNYAII